MRSSLTVTFCASALCTLTLCLCVCVCVCFLLLAEVCMRGAGVSPVWGPEGLLTWGQRSREVQRSGGRDIWPMEKCSSPGRPGGDLQRQGKTERERGREGGRGRETGREREREKNRKLVCVH